MRLTAASRVIATLLLTSSACLSRAAPAPKISSEVVSHEYCYTVGVLCKGDKGCRDDNGELRLRLTVRPYVQNVGTQNLKVQRAAIGGDYQVAANPADFAKNRIQAGVTGTMSLSDVPGENIPTLKLNPGGSQPLPMKPVTFQIGLNPSADSEGVGTGTHWLRFWVGAAYKYSDEKKLKERGLTSEPMAFAVDQDLNGKMRHLAEIWNKKKRKPAGEPYCE